MRKLICTALAILASASVAAANPLNLGWVTVSSLPPRGPVGGAGSGPANVSDDPAGPQGPFTAGDCFYYQIDDGANADNSGSASHFEVEGINFGSNRSQSRLQWNGLLSRLKTDADTTFGANQWTIRRVWAVYDEASFSFGTTGGDAIFAEIPSLTNTTPAADFGAPSSPTQTAVALGIPVGYHSHHMNATAGGSSNQSFMIYDGSVAPALPTGSIAFTQIPCGSGDDIVVPVSDTFTIYNVPRDDFSGGAGAGMAVSFDGFLGGTFGFSPQLVFEVCYRGTSCTSNSIPNAVDFAASAPINGGTCNFTLHASDADFGDTLIFTINSPGTLGGSLVATGPAVQNGGDWEIPVQYTIPANTRGIDELSFSVSDGANSSNIATIRITLRGDATQNTVAFGASTGTGDDTMRLYTGAAVPNGGTAGTRDILSGPSFAQSTEFDNYAGIRHNPQGNLLAADFGPGPNGPGRLFLYATQANCNDEGGIVLFTFDAASTGLGSDSRPTGLSISPDNTKLAVVGTNTFSLIILNYTTGPDVGLGGTGAASVSLFGSIDISSIMATNKSLGTTWLDNNTVLITDTDGNLQLVDVPTGTVLTSPFAPYVAAPKLLSNISLNDIEYNPEISPYIYVAVGEFATVTTNTIYVVDPATQTIVPQSAGQLYTDYSDGTQETFREIGLDCYGNLFIGTFVDFSFNTNVKYLPNATDVANITGGDASLVVWRTVDTGHGEGTSNFSGLDVAVGTTIGSFGGCTDSPPVVEDIALGAQIDQNCVISVAGSDANLANTITFSIDNPGSAGGTLTLTGSAAQNGSDWTQSATYAPAPGFRGVECFTFRANDGTSNSNDGQICISVRDSATDGTIAFGGSLADSNQTMRLYYGQHTMNGGTDGDEDALSGPAFAQSAEFDNFGDVWHNPLGNLLALNFGTTGTGGSLYVYATQAECAGNPGVQIFAFDDATVGPALRSRVTGLSVSPDNSKIAVYGVDTKRIYVLDYSIPGGPSAVGFGGSDSAAVVLNTSIDLSGINTSTRSMGTTWLNNTTLLWTDEIGNLYTVTTAGAINLVRPSPRPTAAISLADIEYNPSISPNIYVSIGEFATGVTTNTLYVVSSAGFGLVNVSGGASFSDQSAVGLGTGTFREIGLSTGGNLFIATFVDNADRVSIRYIANATTPSSITDNSAIAWNEQDAGQSTTNFAGLDVAAGVPAAACALPGDLSLPTPDGLVNGADVQRFTECYLSSFGGAPTGGCNCADVAAPFGTIDSADLAAFVNTLLQ